MTETMIRAYERSDLPIEEKLPSLARRFTSLADAPGLEPWDPPSFHAWVLEREDGSAARHAGLFILNLFGAGPWDTFDILAATRVWDEGDRQAFINWMRVWRFREGR